MFKEVFAQFFPHGDCSEYAHYVFTTIDHNCDGIVNFEVNNSFKCLVFCVFK